MGWESFKELRLSNNWDLPGGPLVKDLPANAGDVGSIPDWGTKIPQATQRSQKTKQNKTM